MLRVTVVLALVKLSVSTFDPELQALYEQLPRDQFIEYFNAQNYSWKIAHHPHLEGQHLCGAILSQTRRSDIEIKYHDPAIYSSLPENFDSRQKWPNCQTINEIYNQGNCSSCWAFSTASVASDRTCISKGLNVRLSEQDFDCLQPICDAGIADKSFGYWQNSGLVTQDCKPYNIYDTKGCVTECQNPSIDYANDKHFAESFYGISSNDDDIKAELFTNGPIYAGFQTYSDFNEYDGGIYVHQYGEPRDGHAVRVIGYGEENGVEYWLIANSWGSGWGENGFGKIKKKQPELRFENGMYAGIPKN